MIPIKDSDDQQRLSTDIVSDVLKEFVINEGEYFVIHQPGKIPPHPFGTFWCAVRSNTGWRLEPDVNGQQWYLYPFDYGSDDQESSGGPEINITLGDDGPNL